MANPSLIQEFNVMSQLFVPTPSVNVMKIIEANALPNIHTLDLYLLARSWFGDGWDTNSPVSCGRLRGKYYVANAFV